MHMHESPTGNSLSPPRPSASPGPCVLRDFRPRGCGAPAGPRPVAGPYAGPPVDASVRGPSTCREISTPRGIRTRTVAPRLLAAEAALDVLLLAFITPIIAMASHIITKSKHVLTVNPGQSEENTQVRACQAHAKPKRHPVVRFLL